MNLDEEIQKTRKAALLVGPKIDREIERLHRAIRRKIERGELSPEIERIMRKGDSNGKVKIH
jgi:hypothetical protein